MSASVVGLAAAVRGRVVGREGAGYEEARALYNGMIDKRPAAIAYCVDANDVSAAVRYANEHGLRIAVRSGGHNGGGLGSVDDGLVIDLSELHEIAVDVTARLARVGGGTLLKDLVGFTHQYGLTVPVGIVGTTGVGGLTLGGGIGHLTRALGLTIDNLVAATVVLADGSIVQCDSERDADLFWALRGGGGNFGVVTQFTFQLHALTDVLAGPVMYSLEDTVEVMRWYTDFIGAAPDALGGFPSLMSVPPGPPFPEELHLQKVCAIIWTQGGTEESPALREARAFGKPLLDGIAPMPLPVWNTAFDALFPPGEQWYWRGEFFDAVPDGALEQHAAFAAQLPTWKSLMHLYPVDGAAARVGNDETAWGYRGAKWAQVIAGVSPEPEDAAMISEWTRSYSDALKPYAMGGGYSNFEMDDPGRVHGMYGGNYDRLAGVKAQYDPANVFRVNQNIKPAG